MKASQSEVHRWERDGKAWVPIHDAASPTSRGAKLPAIHGDNAIRRAWRQKPSLKRFRRIASLKELHHSSVTDLLQR